MYYIYMLTKRKKIHSKMYINKYQIYMGLLISNF